MPITQTSLHIRRGQWRSVAALLVAALLVLSSEPANAVGIRSDQPVDVDTLCNSQKKAVEKAQAKGENLRGETARITARARDLSAAIDAHNAKPHTFQIPAQQAAANAYEAERQQLERERSAVRRESQRVQSQLTTLADKLEKAANTLSACEQGMRALAMPALSSAGLRLGSPAQMNRLEDAVQNFRAGGSGGSVPVPKEPNQKWAIPPGHPLRPLYNSLRPIGPSKYFRNEYQGALQGRLRPNIGDADPAYPGRTITGPNAAGQSRVSADHILPLPEVMSLPGFTDLNARNMAVIVNSPLNYQWLSFSANWAKSSRMAAALSDVDPEWGADQFALREQTRTDLERAISNLRESQ